MARTPLLNRNRAAAFLCYHSVAPRGPRYLTVDQSLFEHQLDQLSRRGVVTGGIDSLRALANGGRGAPTAFLTFDDGFLDNHDTVLPLLRERALRAFVFVIPPLVDTGAALAWPEVAVDAARFPETMRSVTWPMVETMAEDCFEVGSHTLTHPHLSRLGPEELREQLWDSRCRVKERLGRCDTIAFPFGDWSPEVHDATRDCGYEFAFTLPTKVGQARADALSIPRVNVDYRDRGGRFTAKLSAPGRAVYLSSVLGTVRGAVRRATGRR